MIDPILFKDLLEKDPGEVKERCGAEFDSPSGAYDVRFWGRPVQVIPKEGRVDSDGLAFTGPWAYVPLIIVHYLLSAGAAEPVMEWVSEKDLPGGAAFFRGPHTLPVHLITQRFEPRPEAFEAACTGLGGASLDMADAAFSFPLLPGIPGAVLFWQSDEMFGAEAKLLFDRTISRNLPLDIVYAMGVTLCQVLSDSAGDGTPED